MMFVLCTGAASGAVRLEGSAAGEGCRSRAQLPVAEGRGLGAPQGIRRRRPSPVAKDDGDQPWGPVIEGVVALGAHQDHLPPWGRDLSFDQEWGWAVEPPQLYPPVRPERSLR